MGSEQSSQASPAGATSGGVRPRNGDAKNYAYLSPIGSNENIDASAGAGAAIGTGAAESGTDDPAASSKRLSAPNGTRLDDVSPAVEAAKVPTLQAQLQAKVSAHVVSGQLLLLFRVSCCCSCFPGCL